MLFPNFEDKLASEDNLSPNLGNNTYISINHTKIKSKIFCIKDKDHQGGDFLLAIVYLVSFRGN